jgi:hypothetical protein
MAANGMTNQRMVSSSAPLPDINKKKTVNTNIPLTSDAGKRRKPATKTSGTVTRRSNNPTGGRKKRNDEISENDLKFPPIVGSGFGGARALKNNNAL